MKSRLCLIDLSSPSSPESLMDTTHFNLVSLSQTINEHAQVGLPASVLKNLLQMHRKHPGGFCLVLSTTSVTLLRP